MTDPLRILHLEDSPVDAELVRSLLEAEGFRMEVTCVDTRNDFEQALRNGGFDLIFSDVSLPSYDGQSALVAARDLRPEVPFLFVSGTMGEENAIESLKRGATDYVLKQGLSRLAPAVRRALGEAQERRRLREAEAALRESEERYRGIVEDQTELICRFRPDGTLTFVNEAYARCFGRSPGELTGTSFLEFVVGEDREVIRSYIASLLAGASPRLSEYRVVDAAGRIRWQEWNDRVFRDEQGRVVELQSVGRDITERKQAEQTIHQLAYFDRLTGLPNRSRLEEHLGQCLAEPGTRSLALLVLNVHRFGEINSTLGRRNGDLVLQEVARRLERGVGDRGLLSRLGDDDFAVVLVGSDAEAAGRLARNLLSALEAPLLVGGLPIRVEASAGAAVSPRDGQRADALIQRAGVAMDDARQTGSDFAAYGPDRDPFSPRRLTLMAELSAAIEQGQLFLEYQPRVAFASGRINGLEALVRWQHPTLGVVPPAQFIPLAEPSGLIRPLTHWVLNKALLQMETWRREGWPFPVAVNLSARNLQDPTIELHLLGLLEALQLEAGWVDLELTESAILADPRRATEVLAKLKRRGFNFVVDDFGTGYSSLAHLRELPISGVKIDRSFVRTMATDAKDAAIVRAILELGHNLGLSVVAEGVEDEKTWRQLKALGCDAAQGYFMARPMGVAEVGRWLRESRFGRPGGASVPAQP